VWTVYAAGDVDAVFLALLPTIVLAVAGVVLIERLRIREGGDRYQFREYRPDRDREHGNGSNGNGSHPSASHPKRSHQKGSRPGGEGR
jgi:hypothetical protein